jgi:3-hydroxyethyl bacteriochlorophyllide a dehydrogenase
METTAVVLEGPKGLGVRSVPLVPAGDTDVVVDIHYSGISTGTEKLLWSGEMPPFPGMGYPLVPGYEAMGEVVDAPANSNMRPGDTVFVPGASCYGEIRGLFGAAAARIATPAKRLVRLDRGTGPEGALLALAATARHAVAGDGAQAPDLIVGHGVLGRLLARFAMLRGGPAPVVWETDPARRAGDHGYDVIDPETDSRRDYRVIFDASGDAALLDTLVGRLAKGGRLWKLFVRDGYNVAIAGVPSRRVRRLWLDRLLGSIAPSATICLRARFLGPENITIGDRTSIGTGSLLDGRGGLRIEHDVDIAPQVNIWTLEHDPHSLQHDTRPGSVVVGHHAWLAARATILPNVTIGAGAIVGASSVVTRNVEELEIVGGSPARHIGWRKNDLSYELSFGGRFR